jgi:cytochrome c oxidase subunit 2
MFVALCLAVLATAAAVGCSSSSGGSGSGSNGGGMMGGGSGSGDYSSTGQRIFLAGVGGDGQPIAQSASRVARSSLMMGGGGCASCHGADGRGGTLKTMSGTAIKAPDVTYDALVKGGFTDATIRRAILRGLDDSGQPLDAAMPRWRMSSADLDATIAYLTARSAR